jgi:hypothetical protein
MIAALHTREEVVGNYNTRPGVVSEEQNNWQVVAVFVQLHNQCFGCTVGIGESEADSQRRPARSEVSGFVAACKLLAVPALYMALTIQYPNIQNFDETEHLPRQTCFPTY